MEFGLRSCRGDRQSAFAETKCLHAALCEGFISVGLACLQEAAGVMALSSLSDIRA